MYNVPEFINLVLFKSKTQPNHIYIVCEDVCVCVVGSTAAFEPFRTLFLSKKV